MKAEPLEQILGNVALWRMHAGTTIVVLKLKKIQGVVTHTGFNDTGNGYLRPVISHSPQVADGAGP